MTESKERAMNLPTTRLRWSWIPLFSLLWIAPAPDPAAMTVTKLTALQPRQYISL